MLENGYDVWNRTKEEDQRRWLENLYQASCDMLRSFYEAQSAGKIPERNLCVVRYEDLINNLEPTMERVLRLHRNKAHRGVRRRSSGAVGAAAQLHEPS